MAAVLEHEITSGRWEAGARIASEPELGAAFGVSRSVVRQALQRLEQEGLIVRRKGHGTFVAESRPRSWLLQSAAGFFQDEVDRRGRRVTSRILRIEVAQLPGWAADALDLPDESAGVTMERLRWLDDQVALHVSDYLPERLADTVLGLRDDPSESLYERLKRLEGLEVAGGRRAVEAAAAGPKLAKLLEVEPGSPLAFIESVLWDRDLVPFHCFRTWLRTDRIRIEMEVSSARPGATPRPSPAGAASAQPSLTA
ncbi:MAG TPA: GntR family transcriptional regulator [Gaiellales bacterium]|nr:GntR family transcriptional regulator [Gaiellales bacterium]